MRRVDRTVEGSNSRDDLDQLVVRDIVRLSLCEKTSPLNSLSGDGSTSSANTASFSPFREQILTFFRLQALAFIVRDLRSFRFLLPSLFDHGLQVYASTMLKPDYWQAYLSGSKIFGEFGDP